MRVKRGPLVIYSFRLKYTSTLTEQVLQQCWRETLAVRAQHVQLFQPHVLQRVDVFRLFPVFLYTLLLQHYRVLLNKPHTNSCFAASHTTAFSTLTWDSSCIPASLITREAKNGVGIVTVCVHSAWDLDRKKANKIHIFLVPQCFYRLLPSLQPKPL